MKKWEDSVEARTGYSKTKKSFMLLSGETRYGIHMTGENEVETSVAKLFVFPTGMSFIELVQYLFSQPIVKDNKLAFLSQNICQDPLENHFGCQRQRGGTSDNPSVHEYYQNTKALRVVDSFCRSPTRGNCRGANKESSRADSHTKPLTRR